MATHHERPTRTLRIANAAGFLGDRVDAARQIVDRVEVDYLTVEHLAELTMSILARQREKDRSLGYARDFIDLLRSVCPALFLQPQLKIVTNAGGTNPRACAEAAAEILVENGSPNLAIGVVRGDDLLHRLEELTAAGCGFGHLDTGKSFFDLKKPVVAANAYLGARPIVNALNDGARIVITGRVADASLTVGPAMHAFGWAWDDWKMVARATVAGHLIECGAQVTGGYSTSWKDFDLADVGYPIAEIDATGRTTITKPPGTGGAVTRQTVVEQLVYEIGDPAHYLTPDVDADFTTVQLTDRGADVVEVDGASGHSPPRDYKVSLAYHAGFTATAELLVWGTDCVEKANRASEIVFARTEAFGELLNVKHVELLGTGAGIPRRSNATLTSDHPISEAVLRITVQSERRSAAERFACEIAPLITSGPAGLAGYATGRPHVRPVFAHWPTLVPKDAIEPIVEVRTAKEWQ